MKRKKRREEEREEGKAVIFLVIIWAPCILFFILFSVCSELGWGRDVHSGKLSQRPNAQNRHIEK